MKEDNILSMIIDVIRNGFKNKTPVIMSIVSPIIVMFILGYLVSVAGTTEPVTIGIVNLDNGIGNISASSTIIQELQSQDNVTIVTLSSENDVKNDINDKSIDGALVFGENFTTDLIMKKNAVTNLSVDGIDQTKDILITKAVSNATALAVTKLQGGNTVPLTINTENIYENNPNFTDLFIPNIMALFTFILSIMITVLTLLDDKKNQVFKRRLETPIKSVIAYTLGISVFTFTLAIIVLLYAVYIIGITLNGDIINAGLLLMLIALVGTSIGVLISSMAKTERQAFGLVALIILVQVLFAGFLIPLSKFYTYIQVFSNILPMTYGLDAVKSIVIRGFTLGDVWIDILALVIILILSLTLSVIMLKIKAKVIKSCTCSNN